MLNTRQIGIPTPRYSAENYEVPVQIPWRPESEARALSLWRATVAVGRSSPTKKKNRAKAKA